MLGAGGQGQVFRAWDDEVGAEVAMKLVDTRAPGRLDRLKREFRALTRIRHPNLVVPYELHAAEGHAWLTMELIEGEPIDARVLALQATDPDAWEERFLAMFVALVDAVGTIHHHGVFHRDIKPGNVLVRSSGEPVLIDAGLAAATADGPASAVGTPAYMAPEQRTGARQTEAVDWYALGGVAWRCLTGLHPHDAGLAAVAVARAAGEREPARRLPPPWNELVPRLLDPQPERRPRAPRILEALAGAARADLASTRPPVPPPLLGRARDLERLREQEAEGGVVLVYGEPGVGKSRLVATWLAEARTRGWRALGGRCDPRETLPFAGLDDLGAQLSVLPEPPRPRAQARARPQPDDPALTLVDSLAGPAPAPTWWRRRDAFTQLRRHLHDAARVAPVALVVEDVHWAGEDTRELLAELARPPLPPGLLVVLTERGHPYPSVRPALPGPVVAVPLAPLVPSDARALARELGADLPDLDACAGNPLLIAEACREEERRQRLGLPGGGWALAGRADALPEPARTVAEALAVAGAPLRVGAVLRHAGGGPRVLADLLAASLVQILPGPAGMELRPIHQRVADAMGARLGAEQRAERHRWIAELLARSGDERTELRVEHTLASGDARQAAELSLDAARRATRALAFGLAREHYERALNLAPDLADAPTVAALAEVHAAAGHGGPAADRWREAASLTSDASRRRRFLLRASEQELRGPRPREGRQLLDQLLAEHGLRAPASDLRVAATVLAWRLLGPPAPPTAPERDEINLLQSAAASLASLDPLRAEYYGLRHLAYARTGEDAARLALALAYELMFRARFSAWTERSARLALAEADDAADRAGDPYARAMVDVGGTMLEWSVGRLEAAVRRATRAIHIFHQLPASHAWELASAALFKVGCDWALGDGDAVATFSDEIAAETGARRDPWPLDVGHYWTLSRGLLLRGEVDRAEAVLAETRARWQGRPTLVGEWAFGLALSDVALVRGRIDAAWNALLAEDHRVRRTLATLLPALAGDYFLRRGLLAATLLDPRTPWTLRGRRPSRPRLRWELAWAVFRLRTCGLRAGRAMAALVETMGAFDVDRLRARLPGVAEALDAVEQRMLARCVRAAGVALEPGSPPPPRSRAEEIQCRLYLPPSWFRRS